MTRPTIHLLVTQDLGYCCEWFFFSRFRRTGIVAARLGVTERAVRQRKAELRDRREGCQGCPNCMDRQITLDLRSRR